MRNTVKKQILEITGEPEGRLWIWGVAGPSGGVHIWAQQSGSLDFDPYYGGVEIHRATQGEYDDKTPSQQHCWLLEGPCWHDGSSLFFSEKLLPLLVSNGPEACTEAFFSIAWDWYVDNFKEDPRNAV